MGIDEPKIGDILGIRPVGEAINTLTVAGTTGASAFLSRICLPAAEEFGLLLQDKVRAWRANNVTAVLVRAEEKVRSEDASVEVHAHPRLVGIVLEQTSWIDAENVQDLWAGLLASACTQAGDDDSNLMFTDLLSRLSGSQVRMIAHACINATKTLHPNGLISAESLVVTLDTLREIAQVDDLHRLDRELDHLRSLELIDAMFGGFGLPSSTTANVTPTALALQMYVRCNGTRQDPISFFGLA